MLPQRNGLSLQSPLSPLSVLVFHLFLTHSVTGQSQLMGPPQPIVATVGDDIILPCHLEPAVDVAAKTLEWTRSDLDPEFVFVRRAGQDLVHSKHPSYKGRTSLFTDELKQGNISLKLSDVRPSDAGRYRCFIPDMVKGSFVELVVSAVSSPVISLAGIDRDKGGVVLQCESAGWYPEPEVLWLDGEGNLLSAGPTETVRGPDDLYTVSSRVTVEKRHSNSFTCRVQQNNINQTTETHIQVPDDFFKVQSSSSIIIGLAVGLAVWIVMFMVLLLLFLWKWRQNIIKTKRSHCDEAERGQKKNSSKTHKTEDQSVPVEEREQLMTTETEKMEMKKQRSQQQLLEEQQRREEAEKEVQTLKEELETKKTEVETKQSELQWLHEEKQRNEVELQTLKEELEDKNKELETTKRRFSSLPWGGDKIEQQRKEVQTLRKQLVAQQMELYTKIKKIDEKQTEVQQLQNQIQRMSNLQTLMEILSKNMELERSRATPAHSSSSALKWPIGSGQKFQEEQQRREEAENKVKNLMKELQTQIKEMKEQLQRGEEEAQRVIKEVADRNNEWQEKLNDERTRREAAEREVEASKKELKTKMEEQLQRKEQEAQRAIKELTDKNIEWQKKLNDERIRREAAEKELEALKKTKPESVPVQRGASSPTAPVTVQEVHSYGRNIGLKNTSNEPESVPVQHGASLPTAPVTVQVDPCGRYIRLKNISYKDQQLKDWKLQVQVNNTNPITYKFDHPFSIKSWNFVTMWSPGYRQYCTSTDLEWRELKSWNPTDQVQITLINNTGQIQHQLSL